MRRIWFGQRFRTSEKLHIGMDCEFVSPEAMSFFGVTMISSNCYFNAEGGSISVGDWTAFNKGVHINASCGGNIKIGARCPIGPGVVMRTANHKFKQANKFIQEQGHECADIVIEDDCWIGANAIILPRVVIGRGAVIGAGAVVTKDIPAYAVAIGIPAKVIRYREPR